MELTDDSTPLKMAREALERIARPLDCGCVPCVGQCRSEEAMRITVDEMQSEAREALAAISDPHASDCAINNAPALEVGGCDCSEAVKVALEAALRAKDWPSCLSNVHAAIAFISTLNATPPAVGLTDVDRHNVAVALSHLQAGAPSREAIARLFLFESGVFNSDAEIRANQDHTLVIRANRAADRIRALYPSPPAPAVLASREGVAQLDRMFIGQGEYVRADEAVRQITALQAKLDALQEHVGDVGVGWRLDAERWRALISCPHIHMQGSAGVNPRTGERTEGTHVHFGAEFWAAPYASGNDPQNNREWGVYCLTALADAIIERTAPPAPDAHLEVGREEDHGSRAVPQSTISGPDDQADDQPA